MGKWSPENKKINVEDGKVTKENGKPLHPAPEYDDYVADAHKHGFGVDSTEDGKGIVLKKKP